MSECGLFYDQSNSSEWYTPKEYLDRAYRIMGKFFDPCPPRHYDAFFYPWKGAIFLNPPYGRGVDKWFGKLRDSCYRGECTEFIVLWKAAPETKAWRILNIYSQLVAFPQKRIHFINGETGELSKRPTFPSAFFYYGPHEEEFKKEFSDCLIYTEVSA